MTKSKHTRCLSSSLSAPLLPLPCPGCSIHPSTHVFLTWKHTYTKHTTTGPSISCCIHISHYTHTTHACTHAHIQTHAPTGRHTSSPPLTVPVSTHSSRDSLGDVGDSRSVASWNARVVFEPRFHYLRSKCFLLKEAHHLANSGKGCERFSDVSNRGCVPPPSKMDDFCRLKCLAENAIPSWTSPFTCEGTVRCHPTLKLLVGPVLIIYSSPRYRYVNQNLRLIATDN